MTDGKIKLRVTATREYWADPLHYGTNDPEAMARLDAAQAYDVFALLDHEDTVVTVTPV